LTKATTTKNQLAMGVECWWWLIFHFYRFYICLECVQLLKCLCKAGDGSMLPTKKQ